jgi:hypothetical protein
MVKEDMECLMPVNCSFNLKKEEKSYDIVQCSRFNVSGSDAGSINSK